MKQRDEWLWDGNCDNCRLKTQCTLSCNAHKHRKIKLGEDKDKNKEAK